MNKAKKLSKQINPNEENMKFTTQDLQSGKDFVLYVVVVADVNSGKKLSIVGAGSWETRYSCDIVE